MIPSLKTKKCRCQKVYRIHLAVRGFSAEVGIEDTSPFEQEPSLRTAHEVRVVQLRCSIVVFLVLNE